MTNFLFNKMISLCDIAVNIKWNNNVLDAQNASKIRDAYILSALALLDLAEPSFPDYTIFSQVKQWLFKMCSQDVVLLEKHFKEMWVWCNNQPILDINAFLATFKESFYAPSEAGHLLMPFQWYKEVFNSELSEDAEVTRRLFCNYFLSFPFKVNLRLDIEDKLILDYKEMETYNECRVYDSAITRSLNEIIREWLAGFDADPQQFLREFRHGPGAVADIPRRREASNSKKSARLCFPSKYNLLEECGVKEGALPSTSEIVFVPKSMKTYRTISKEPSAVQFLQQGYSRALAKYCNKTIRGIDLERQGESRRLARIGSYRGKYSTIDLSSASDTVTLTLVKLLFADTAIEDIVIDLRTTHTLLPNGEELALEKYAPMGSALCFPIETITFAAVCEYCTRLSGYHFKDKPYFVYGDDIVCRHEITDLVLDILNRLGFLVNFQKTYFNPASPFREACGGEYFHMKDITPVRLPRNFPGFRLSNMKEAQCLVDLANRCFDNGLKNVRRLLLNRLHVSGYRIPFSRNGKIGIKTYNPTNFHLRRVRSGKWNVAVKHHSISTRPYRGEKTEDEYADWVIRKYCDPECQCYTSEPFRPVSMKTWNITPLYLLQEE